MARKSEVRYRNRCRSVFNDRFTVCGTILFFSRLGDLRVSLLLGVVDNLDILLPIRMSSINGFIKHIFCMEGMTVPVIPCAVTIPLAYVPSIRLITAVDTAENTLQWSDPSDIVD